MVDNITVWTDWDCIDMEGDFAKVGTLSLVPYISPITNEIERYVKDYNNLRFVLNGSRLSISNSLHKFYKRNNYTDFSFSEIKSAIKNIESLTGISASHFNIAKLEFGLNIIVGKVQNYYLTRFIDYKGKEFDKMKNKACQYGVKAQLTEYALKVYDKSEQVKRVDRVKVQENLMRIEIQYFRKRRVPLISTLADLTIKENYSGLLDEMLSILSKVNFSDEADFRDVRSRDREMYFAGQVCRFWEIEKEVNKETYKKKKRRYREIQKKVKKENLLDEFRPIIVDKFNYLIDN